MATLRETVVSRGHGLAEETVKVDGGVVENAGHHVNFLRVLERFIAREVSSLIFLWVEFAVFIPS